jgi:proteic killer suppression protein
MGLDISKRLLYIGNVDVVFASDDLDRLETDARYTAGLSQGVVRAFRKRMQLVRAALDERDLYSLKSARFEKLEGKRQHQHSMRLNDQYRLILEILKENPRDRKNKVIKIVSIEDYH